MIKSPCDFIFCRLEKTFEDEIITPSGIKFYKPTHLSPEWNVTVIGEVVSVPNRITKDKDKLQFQPDLKGLVPEAEVGDRIVFSYMVVNDCELRDRLSPIFKNRFYYNGEFLWKVNYQFVYGYFKNGNLMPASGYVFLEELSAKDEALSKGEVEVSDSDTFNGVACMKSKSGLYMPEMAYTKPAKNKARVVSIGKNRQHEPILGIKEGDTIRYDQRFGMKYTIKDKNYIILHQNKIVGKEV